MATVETPTAEVAEREQEQPRRGRGRPPAPKSAVSKIPAPPGINLSFEQFVDYWRSLLPEHAPRLTGYLYRLWPIIQQDPKYIDKLPEPPESKVDILRQWGTGEYELRLTDLDKGLGRGEVCRTRWRFSESHSDNPPVIENMREVLDMGRKENKAFIAWAQANGRLNTMGPTQGGGSDAAVTTLTKALVDATTKKETGSEATAVRAAVDTMKAANEAAIDVVKKQVQTTTPAPDALAIVKALKEGQTDPIALMTAMLGAIKVLIPAPAAPTTDPRVELLFMELKALREQNTSLMTRLIDRKENSGGEESDFTKRIIAKAVDKLLDGDGDSGGGRRRSAWAEAFEMAGGAETVNKALDVLGMFAGGFGRPAGMRPPQRPMGAAAPPIQQPQPSDAAATTETADAGNPAPQPGSPQEQAMQQQLMAFMQRHWLTILKFIQEDRPGQELAELLMDAGQLTPMQLGLIRDMAGRDAILAVIKATPEAYREIQPVEQQFVKLLDGLLAWKPGWDDEEPPPGSAPPPAGGKVQ